MGGRRIAALAAAVLLWCVASLGALAQPRPEPGVILRDWYTLMNELVRHTATYSPPVASRSFAYLGITAFEAAVGGSDKLTSLVGQLHGLDQVPQREAGAGYDETVVISAAMSDAIVFYFGNTGPTGQRAINRAQSKWRALAVDGVPEDVVQRSEAFGKAMAAAIFAWSQNDGGATVLNMGFPYEYELPKGDDKWVPTSLVRQQQLPLLPEWGHNRTFATPDGTACPLPGNPTYSTEPGSDFYKQAEEVYETVKDATPEQMAIARFWSDDPMLSMTPPGHWVSIALQVAEREDLPLDDNVDLLARMGIAMSDAFVGCWRQKYVYDLVRPITYIKKVIDPKWEPILNTPPFPEYPSGHSTVSGAMDAVLTAFFGDNYAFEDKTGSPDGRNPRHYASFHEAALEAGISRLYGGIHFRSAIEDGLAQGHCIAAYTIALKTRK
ncbi:vanadium-dependent haloperoxidase [Devosia sp. A16]|uniref:vanadium-dependent haloperoxidase n=1 Tax=Devosia sp. A16 TaxID=1736675 RepID=UPI0006D80476|nr:vanadium-dependent haloperoxidase [Devosia sp. A16]